MRLALIIRDGFRCWLCGREDMIEPVDDEGGNSVYEPRLCTFDHLIPKSHGGRDDYYNLKLACARCNSKRGDSLAPLSKRMRRKAERAGRRHNRRVARRSHTLVRVQET
jgi:5-methylcytosine-specific restriction endonuclease McrA